MLSAWPIYIKKCVACITIWGTWILTATLKNDGFCKFIENVATNQYLLRYTYGNLVIRRATNKLTQRTPQLVLETLEDNGVFHNEERILIEKFTEQLIANQIQFETRK